MSSFNRRKFNRNLALSLVAMGSVAGCGFRPAYGTGGSAQALRGRVLINAPKDENDFALMQEIERRLGAPQAPAYDLKVKVSLSEEGLAITPTQETTRYHVLGKADYSLTETATGRVVTKGSVDNFTSYSATGTTVSTLTAKRDAYGRLMVILADQIVARLLAASARGAAA